MKIVLNEENFKDLINGQTINKEISRIPVKPPIKVEIILEDILFDRMRYLISQAGLNKFKKKKS